MDRFNNGLWLLAKKRITNVFSHSVSYLTLQLSQCVICHGTSSIHPQICPHCLTHLPFFNIEKVTGDLLNWPAMNSLFHPRYFDHLISVTPYTWPISHWISQLKYQRRHDYASLLGFVLQHQWQKASTFNHQPDIVLSVPLHIRKWQFRGFNQAHLLAKKFGHFHQIPYLHDLLLRVNSQSSQVGQTGAQRRKNIAGSFSLFNPCRIKGKQVLLIDDVITTGTTVNEICRLIKSAGAEKVTVLTLCVSIDKC